MGKSIKQKLFELVQVTVPIFFLNLKNEAVIAQIPRFWTISQIM